jgi:hypothetical protein
MDDPFRLNVDCLFALILHGPRETWGWDRTCTSTHQGPERGFTFGAQKG